MKYLLFDISNLLYRTFYANKTADDVTLAGLATHSALQTLNKYFKQHKPHKVVMAFDRLSWRKAYTKSEQCVSGRPYKGTRRKNMSPAQLAKYGKFLDHLRELETLITEHSTIITLAQEGLEADDLIAGFVQYHQNTDAEITIVSNDGDMLQLLRFPNVKIISPDTGKEKTLEEFNDDPDYLLFFKCIRGDHITDNIQSAFPGVSKLRIEKAYKNSFERVQMMKEVWKDENLKVFRVEDLYNENVLLTDLSAQPEHIRVLIEDTIYDAMEKQRKFSHFHLMKFLGKYDLKKIADSLDQYLPLLSR
jgi:5'-3' exonuclease